MNLSQAKKEFKARFYCWANRLHPAWANPQSDLLSEDEKSLLEMRRSLNADLLRRRVEISSRKQAGEKVRFASKRKLQKAMTSAFQNAFGDRCTSSRSVEQGDLSSSYEMKCCGWIISTHFWFGRSSNLLDYSHSIIAPTTDPAMSLAIRLTLIRWRGSPTELELLMDNDVQPACDAVILMCELFFEEAPKMLEGLEFETVTKS